MLQYRAVPPKTLELLKKFNVTIDSGEDDGILKKFGWIVVQQ